MLFSKEQNSHYQCTKTWKSQIKKSAIFLDMLALPDFAAGAMENWGLVTYREGALLYDEKTSVPSSRESVAVVIAHELAHQVPSLTFQYIFFQMQLIFSNLVVRRFSDYELVGRTVA